MSMYIYIYTYVYIYIYTYDVDGKVRIAQLPGIYELSQLLGRMRIARIPKSTSSNQSPSVPLMNE